MTNTWKPNWGPQPPQQPQPYQPLVAPPTPPKKGHKGLLITGGVIALLVVGGIAAASQPGAKEGIAAGTVGSPDDLGGLCPSVVPVTSEAPKTTAPATTEAAKTTAPAAPKTTAPVLTVSQQQAVKSAESYLGFMAFSRSGLIKQLEFEGFSTADATYAVDHVTVDWMAQAAASAKSYMEMGGFSHKSLLAQLVFEGFTPEQAAYGVQSVGL